MRCRALLALIGSAVFVMGASRDRHGPDDPAKDVEKAIAAGDMRFLGLMSGWGSELPGMPRGADLSPEAVRYILSTGCVEDEAGIRLREAAHDYAAKYNAALMKKMPSLATTRPAQTHREVLGPPVSKN